MVHVGEEGKCLPIRIVNLQMSDRPHLAMESFYTIKVAPYDKIICVIIGYHGKKLLKEVSIITIWGLDTSK